MNIEKKIINDAALATLGAGLKKEGKKIALCSGCFDVLHSGHAVFFNQCKSFADILVVVLGRDEVIKKLKGEERPFNSEANRGYLVAAMQDVDYVILGDRDFMPGKIDFYTALEFLKPDMFILNEDDSGLSEKREFCRKLGVELRLVKRELPKFLQKTSSTEILKKIDSL